MLSQSEIRDVLNREMAIGEEYHLQDIYAFFRPQAEGYTGKTLKHRIRSALEFAKKKSQVSNLRREYHMRIESLQ